MTRDELEPLLAEGESTYLEWKRDFPSELLRERKHPSWDQGRAKAKENKAPRLCPQTSRDYTGMNSPHPSP